MLGVIVFIMRSELAYDKAAIDAGNHATTQLNQVAGRDENGEPVKNSAVLEPQSTNGVLNGVLVTKVTPDGPYAKFWGLKRNDLITEFGPLTVKQVVTDSGAADDYVMDAYQHQSPLTIMRDGQKMTLPSTDGSTPKPSGSTESLQDQLNSIQSKTIPTH